MRTRSLLKSTFDIGRMQFAPPPPTFLLPWRAQLHLASTTPTNFQNTTPEIPPHSLPSSELPAITPADAIAVRLRPGPLAARPGPKQKATSASQATPGLQTKDSTGSAISPTSKEVAKGASAPKKPLVLSPSLQTLLPLLHAQKPQYISAHIHRFPYLLTAGDTLRLPFHMHGVAPGDVLRLNRASLLGSRDYTLKAGTTNTETYDGRRTATPNYLDERLFECRVRVLGVDSGPMVLKEKTKRRQRRVKTVRSKHKYTVLKVMDVRVKSLDELKAGDDTLILG